MRFNPLRAEFVLAGLAQLFGALCIAEAVVLRRSGHAFDVVAKAEDLDAEGLIVGVSLFLILAYVIGILAVQLTFFIPTEYLIAKVRSEKWNDLHQVEERLRRSTTPSDPTPCLTTMAFRDSTRCPTFLDFYWNRMKSVWERLKVTGQNESPATGTPEQHARALLLTLGRAMAPPELAEEYRYRRSNRQVFVSLMPSVFLVGAALEVCITTLTWYWAIPGLLLISVVIIVLMAVLWQSVLYQERIAQALIVDAVFLRRWDPTFPTSIVP
jgi:hypothetical protein